MSLSEYKHKRKFSKTPEPAGKKPAKTTATTLRFVVQKHEATRLHFDVRLEVDGVMKSWAVPKGPSMNPVDKHLAMMVEDHPLEYRQFEGIIPEGNYGAGTVMVWDEGTYTVAGAGTIKEVQAAVKAGLAKGDLKFILHGKKLKGEFVLFRFPKAGDNAWIMMKHQDEYAGMRIVDEDKSALSGRTMKQIANDQSSPQWNNDKLKSEPRDPGTSELDLKSVSGARKAKFPGHYQPMLASLAKEPFDDDNWLYEIKWDGYRALAAVRKGQVELYSRNDIDLGPRYAEIVEDLGKIAADVVLDGEVVVLDSQGRSDFQALQNYGHTHEGQLVYYVFDVLYYQGYDLTKVPLLERKQLLQKLVPVRSRIVFSDHIVGQGTQFFKLAKDRKLEGIIAKKAQGTYQPGARNGDWLKIKLRLEQEAVICGYTKPEGGREGFGSLLLGMYDGKKLNFIGHVGTGFNDAEIHRLLEKFAKLKAGSSPYAENPKVTNVAQWLKPQLVCQIKFSEWTDEGLVRQASYLGLRDDKPAKEVHKEI